MKQVLRSMFDVRRSKPFEPRTSNPEPRTLFQKGFTLIELLVVILVLSLAAALVFPRLPSTDASNLRSSARSLAATFRYLGDRAISTKTSYRMHLNLAESSLTINRLTAGEETATGDNFLGRRGLAGDITIQDVQIPRLGTISDGEVILHFGSGGLEEIVTIHLKGKSGSNYTVTAFPQNGKVSVDEGYREVKL